MCRINQANGCERRGYSFSNVALLSLTSTPLRFSSQGIIEFIPEFQTLMHELNDLMAAGVANTEEVSLDGCQCTGVSRKAF